MKTLLFYLLIAAFLGYGWIENIVKIAHGGDHVSLAMFVLRCIGIFVPPLGAVLGFL